MRAHLIQHDIAWEERSASRRLASATLATATIGAGDLVVFPEMFETGFSMDVERTADSDGSGGAFLAETARTHAATVIGGVVAMGSEGRARNRALAFSPSGAPLAHYDKVHPFSFGREHERFSGGSGVCVFRWERAGENAIVCPAICYDLRFPELFRAGRSLGAEVFVVMANWPAERAAHWRALLIARAIENQAFVLGVNRTGSDPNVRYAGGSIAIGPRGEVLGEAGEGPQALTATLDLSVFREWRTRFPAWHDAKPGLLPRLGPGGAIVGSQGW